MLRWLAVVLAFVFALPMSAQAADLDVDAGVLRYTGTPGKRSNVRLTELGGGMIRVEQFPSTPPKADDEDLRPGTGCTPGNPSTCSNVTTRVALDAGDLSDRVETGWTDDSNGFFGITSIPVTISGGDGNDVLAGGAREDLIDGGPGDDTIDGFAGDDRLIGADGNDDLKPNTGSDTLVGGDGIDTATYGRRVSPVYSLDGLRNDGAAGESDLIGTDVENIEASADADAQTVTITGDGRANRLTVQAGKANLTGGEGADVLEGAAQADLITSRDGSPDTVICNGGIDTVLADTLDTISATCENVQVQATPGGPFDDRPPTLAWTAPAAGDVITANAATMLSVNAADDRGLSKVQFFDDDRLLCELAAPPFNCAYQPRGGDVGRDTLVAIATDGAGQTASAVRAITVRRFSPKDMTLTLRPNRDRRAPYAFSLRGRITRPAPVSPSQGCTGTVTFTARRAAKVITSKRMSLTRTCEYTATFRFRTRTAARIRFQAKFSGNEVLTTASSKTRTARLG